MSWYKHPSVYAQKMARLGCKIFNEYYKPTMPKEIYLSGSHAAKNAFTRIHHQNMGQIDRLSALPWDIDGERNMNRYPPHPQIRELVHVLRKHGLFRDEHMDFNEEMKRLRILRGKRYRVKGGMSGKRAQIREQSK